MATKTYIQTQDKSKWYNRVWLISNFAWLYVALVSAFYDIKNFLKFRREILDLKKDPNSKFNKLGLKVNKLGNVVYTQKIMDRNRVIGLNDRQKNLYLIDVSQTEHNYLFDELLWGEYLLTEFIDFADEEGNMSGYYGITFTFTPMTINNPRFYWILLFYTALIGCVCWVFRSQIASGFLWLVSLL